MFVLYTRPSSLVFKHLPRNPATVKAWKKPVVTMSQDLNITHFLFLAVEAGFYRDVVECLLLILRPLFDSPLGQVGIFSL